MSKLHQRYSKRGKEWETCKNWMDQCSLKGYDVTFHHIYKPQRTSKQVSEWQNVSDNCAGTNLHARGAKEEHDSYQQCLNHVTLRHVYKSSAYFQASEWQNVSDSCA